jgi:hypothetical protein
MKALKLAGFFVWMAVAIFVTQNFLNVLDFLEEENTSSKISRNHISFREKAFPDSVKLPYGIVGGKNNTIKPHRMYEINRDKEGNEMLIAEMDDSYLVTKENWLLKRLDDVNNMMDGKHEIPASQRGLLSARIMEMDTEELQELQKRLLKQMYPYIAELYLRGLYDCQERLQVVLGRAGQLRIKLPTEVLPPAPNDY